MVNQISIHPLGEFDGKTKTTSWAKAPSIPGQRLGALLVLFVVQFPITSTAGRLILCGIYLALAIAGLIINRHHLTATLQAPFIGHTIRHGGHPHQPAELAEVQR